MSFSVFRVMPLKYLFWDMATCHWVIAPVISRQHSGLIFKGQIASDEYYTVLNHLAPISQWCGTIFQNNGDL